MPLLLRWPKLDVHLPVVSKEWSTGSTGGGGVSVGTPEAKLAVDFNYLRLPLNRLSNGKVVKTYLIQGAGIGVGAGIGLTAPVVNGSYSPDDAPGVGSRIVLGPTMPIHPALADFCHYVYVASLSVVYGAAQGSGALILFTSQMLDMTPGIGPLLAAVSTKGAAVCAGTGAASAVGSLGGDVVGYKVWSQGDDGKRVS